MTIINNVYIFREQMTQENVDSNMAESCKNWAFIEKGAKFDFLCQIIPNFYVNEHIKSLWAYSKHTKIRKNLFSSISKKKLLFKKLLTKLFHI